MNELTKEWVAKSDGAHQKRQRPFTDENELHSRWDTFSQDLQSSLNFRLMYLGISRQPKHARDISAILGSKKNELDYGYIQRWVDQLRLGSVWNEILDDIA